jgi:hypothetical protein
MVARRGIIPAGVTRPKTQVTSGFADKRLRRHALGSGRPIHKTQDTSGFADKRLRRQALGSGRPQDTRRKTQAASPSSAPSTSAWKRQASRHKTQDTGGFAVKRSVDNCLEAAGPMPQDERPGIRSHAPAVSREALAKCETRFAEQTGFHRSMSLRGPERAEAPFVPQAPAARRPSRPGGPLPSQQTMGLAARTGCETAISYLLTESLMADG